MTQACPGQHFAPFGGVQPQCIDCLRRNYPGPLMEPPKETPCPQRTNMLLINLPWPDAKLSPNRAKGLHWAKTSGLRAQAFETAYTLTFQAVQQHKGQWFALTTPQVPLTLTFCPPDKRRRDLDNALSSCKLFLDGVATALTIDDARFSPITLKRGEPVKGGAVRVEVGA